jgi:SAM-dependent methyltransferase
MTIDWQKLYLERSVIADSFGEIWDLPVATRYHRVVASIGGRGSSVLEVGAGDRSFQRKLEGYWGNVSYTSCDIDPTHDHDFSHIDEVKGEYDLVCAFEMIEHLTLADAQHMVTKMYDLVRPGGKLALTTPNIYYPPAFLRDVTHITPFCYDELGALLQLAGFKVTSIHRLYHDSLVKKFIRRVLFYPVFRVLGIDFARQIIVVAEKPGQ